MPRGIGILGGTGAEGTGLAYRWARAGEHVMIGSRDSARAIKKAKEICERIGPSARIEGADNLAVAMQCDAVVMAVPFPGHAPLLKDLRTAWRSGTVLIDTTVPLASTVGGRATRMLGVWQGSAAEQARELIPPEIPVAAAFQNLGAELLSSDAPVDCDILICSDDEKAKAIASELATKIPGARPVDGGKLENARIVESVTALLIGLNLRYKVQSAGLRLTGLPL